MHELSLYGQIPVSRHAQVLQILAGIAAMQPQDVVERHLVYRPVRFAAQRAQVGGSQAIQSQKTNAPAQAPKEVFYMQLVCDIPQANTSNLLHATGFNGPEDVIDVDTEPKEELVAPKPKWSMLFYDTPEPGKRPVVSRMTNKTEITERDAHQHMKSLGYDYVTEYVLQGHRLIHENLIMWLHRILLYSNEPSSDSTPRTSMPDINALLPLDESGSYLLQASVRVQDGSKPEIFNKAQSELLGFKETMKGSLDLRVVDRLSLDTRYR
ncbi:MAG: Mediator of RNA polymerase II transcription subunit 18 [Bathelium mastoideum]|nr:MAG: Mediator of RNA polymerase II transcription subunit 18 [Bathelium mastoideum]KAI9688428.1 MAG: Mediator of RNA polymerase II transcription subunit 18 [Bathelium mastoideum]